MSRTQTKHKNRNITNTIIKKLIPDVDQLQFVILQLHLQPSARLVHELKLSSSSLPPNPPQQKTLYDSVKAMQ